MNFMKQDEFLLLMSHCEDRAIGFETQYILSTQDRARLYDAGIRTSHEQPAWARIEPSRGNYDWGYLDRIITRNRDAGLKSLIQLSGWRVPKWCPNEWRAMRKEGHYEEEQLSFWNKEAQDYVDSFYQAVINHYPDEDVGFFFGEFQGGEGALPPTWCLFDWAAKEDYKKVYGEFAEPTMDDPDTLHWLGRSIIEHTIRVQRFLYPKHKEVWNAQQWLMNQWNKGFGNFIQPELLQIFKKEFPDACIVLLQYTYFDDAHPQENVEYVDMLRDISGCEVIVEAMFCSGLPKTTPKAIMKGFRGQIVHVVNDFGASRMEDWMVDNVRNSHNLWKEMDK